MLQILMARLRRRRVGLQDSGALPKAKHYAERWASGELNVDVELETEASVARLGVRGGWLHMPARITPNRSDRTDARRLAGDPDQVSWCTENPNAKMRARDAFCFVAKSVSYRERINCRRSCAEGGHRSQRFSASIADTLRVW